MTGAQAIGDDDVREDAELIPATEEIGLGDGQRARDGGQLPRVGLEPSEIDVGRDVPRREPPPKHVGEDVELRVVEEEPELAGDGAPKALHVAR